MPFLVSGSKIESGFHAQCTCLVRLRVDGFISGWSDEGMIWRRSGQRHARVEVLQGGRDARLLALSN